MFSISKAKNVKIPLIALLLSCTMPITPEGTIMPAIIRAEVPQLSAAIIAGTGLVTAGLLKYNNASNTMPLVITAASAVVGGVVYKYLNPFTLAGKYNEVNNLDKNIGQELRNKRIWKNVFKPKPDIEQLKANISIEYSGEQDELQLFREKDFLPLRKKLIQVRDINDEISKHLTQENTLKSHNEKDTLIQARDTNDEILKHLTQENILKRHNEKDTLESEPSQSTTSALQDENSTDLENKIHNTLQALADIMTEFKTNKHNEPTYFSKNTEIFNNTKMNEEIHALNVLKKERLQEDINEAKRNAHFNLRSLFSTILLPLLPTLIVNPELVHHYIDIFLKFLSKMSTRLSS